MNNIKLNDALRLNQEEIANSKIELNMKAGIDGDDYIDLWLASSDHDKKNGTCPDCGYWGWYTEGTRNFVPGTWVFNFVRVSASEWLLISAGEVISVPINSHAEVRIIDKYKPLFGRLLINLLKGNTFARYTFNLENYIDDAIVKEILPSLYGGVKFPGYDKVRISYKQLELIEKLQKHDWIGALENQKAVYLITDTATGKLYVGSATSENRMLLNRWKNYLDNGHGNNKKLVNLVEVKGLDYIKDNFQFSILENYNARVADDVILQRESWWQKTLMSKTFGYN